MMLPGWKTVKRLTEQLETFLWWTGHSAGVVCDVCVFCCRQQSEFLEETKVKVREGSERRVRKASVRRRSSSQTYVRVCKKGVGMMHRQLADIVVSGPVERTRDARGVALDGVADAVLGKERLHVRQVALDVAAAAHSTGPQQHRQQQQQQ